MVGTDTVLADCMATCSDNVTRYTFNTDNYASMSSSKLDLDRLDFVECGQDEQSKYFAIKAVNMGSYVVLG